MSTHTPGGSYMTFYGIILFIALVFGAFGNMDKKKKKWYIIVTFFIFFVVMAFKSFYMGNDTITYVTYFKQISLYDSPIDFMANSDVEEGYVLLNWLVAKYFGDVRALFVICAAFISFSIGRFVYKYVDVPGIFVCFFVGLTQFDFFVSVMRQTIAVAIYLYAFESLTSNKNFKYIVLSAIAMLFHYTAIIMILVYPFIAMKKIESEKTSNLKISLILGCIVIFSILFLNKIYDVIVMLYPKYKYYDNSVLMDGNPRLAVFLQVAVYTLLLIVPKMLKVGKTTDIKNYNKGERLAMINIAIMMISSGATAFMRFSPVFNLFATMHFSNMVGKLNNDNKKAILLFAIAFSFLFGLVVIVFKTPEWQTTYPIKLEI